MKPAHAPFLEPDGAKCAMEMCRSRPRASAARNASARLVQRRARRDQALRRDHDPFAVRLLADGLDAADARDDVAGFDLDHADAAALDDGDVAIDVADHPAVEHRPAQTLLRECGAGPAVDAAAGCGCTEPVTSLAAASGDRSPRSLALSCAAGVACVRSMRSIRSAALANWALALRAPLSTLAFIAASSLRTLAIVSCSAVRSSAAIGTPAAEGAAGRANHRGRRARRPMRPPMPRTPRKRPAERNGWRARHAGLAFAASESGGTSPRAARTRVCLRPGLDRSQRILSRVDAPSDVSNSISLAVSIGLDGSMDDGPAAISAIGASLLGASMLGNSTLAFDSARLICLSASVAWRGRAGADVSARRTRLSFPNP